MRCLLALLVCTLVSPSQIVTKPEPPAKGVGLRWEATVEAALARAKREDKLVVWAVMLHREVACRRMMRRVWTDAAVVKKARAFVLIPCNAFPNAEERLFPGVTVAQVRANETEMRTRYGDAKEVEAPQHIITDADGKVVVRKKFELDAGELLAFLNSGLRKAGKTVKAEPPVSAPGDPARPDPPAEATEDAEAEAPSEEDIRLVKLIIRAPSNEKEDLTDELLKTAGLPGVKLLTEAITARKIKSEKDRAAIVRRLGYEDHSEFAEALLPLVSDKSKRVRNAAVVSLEEMKNSAAAKPLLARFEKERDPEVKKDILRALGAVGVGDQKARALLIKHAKKRNKLGLNALMSLGPHLTGEPEVRKVLADRWPKTQKDYHLAILYSYWTAKDPETTDDLKKIKKRERSGAEHDLAESVLASIEGRRPEGRRGRGGRGGRNLRNLLGGEWRLIRAWRPLFEQDKVQRNLVKDLQGAFGGRRR